MVLTKSDNPHEMLPLVDEHGNVTGSATRGECHGGSMLLHPVVHLHVFDGAGRIYLQKRPDWKDIQPGKWDTAVGGHIDLGEDVATALRREAREELGLTDFDAEPLGSYVFGSSCERELVNSFRATVDHHVPRPSAELDGGRFWTLAEVADNIGLMTPNLIAELRRFGYLPAESQMKTFHSSEPFTLENGEVLPELDIAYHTFGTLTPEGDNVIWVCHALTANSDVADWWPHTVEAGKFLDPGRYFIVCANILGSHYGTTGPLSVDPRTGEPYFHKFPFFTVRDIVRVHQRLARHLGINRVELLIGSSLGGFQCMEWAIMEPDFARRVALIATTPVTMPWAAAFNESQRMAIDADATFAAGGPGAGMAGLACARSIALLSYRGGTAYDLTQADAGAETDPASPFRRKVHSYQQYQGQKLCRRFNAYSYYRLSAAVDSHDVGRGRGGVTAALATFRPKALVIAISGDILFPPQDHQLLASVIPSAEYHVIDSNFGHDGFLIEHVKLNDIIRNFMNH